jgi:hypothetical protein
MNIYRGNYNCKAMGRKNWQALLFGFGLDSNVVFDLRVDIDGGNGSKGGASPVDNSVLNVRVSLAAKLEPSGKNWVEVST